MRVVPAVLDTMAIQKGVQAVVQSGLACLRNLATHDGNKVGVREVCRYACLRPLCSSPLHTHAPLPPSAHSLLPPALHV